MVKVSIIIPVKFYNPFFTSSLESTLSCMGEGMELILVADHADTACLEIMEQFVLKYREKVCLIQSPGKGIVDALHAGLACARGAYIARMDADDKCLNDRLIKQQQYLDNHPEVGLVSSWVRYGGDVGKNAGFARFVAGLNKLDTHQKMYARRFADAVVAHPSVMFRRELLQLGTYRKTNLRGETVPEDFDLWLRWLNEGVVFAKIKEYLLEWTDLEQRLSRTHQAYAKRSFRNAAAAGFRAPSDKPVWVCGYGRPVERRLAPFKERGLRVSGYIALEARERADGIPVITLEDSQPLRGNALILVMVGNLYGRAVIQHFFEEEQFQQTVDYLWMV